MIKGNFILLCGLIVLMFVCIMFPHFFMKIVLCYIALPFSLLVISLFVLPFSKKTAKNMFVLSALIFKLSVVIVPFLISLLIFLIF